jgi:hypothetical protein
MQEGGVVLVTLGLYSSLLESGLALIAACLAILSSLVIRKGSLSMMRNSIRLVSISDMSYPFAALDATDLPIAVETDDTPDRIRQDLLNRLH